MRCEEPPEKGKTSISWGSSAGRRIFQPPEKEKTSISWGSPAGTSQKEPPERKKIPISGGSPAGIRPSTRPLQGRHKTAIRLHKADTSQKV